MEKQIPNKMLEKKTYNDKSSSIISVYCSEQLLRVSSSSFLQ